jgi:hypothetical protein
MWEVTARLLEGLAGHVAQAKGAPRATHEDEVCAGRLPRLER